MSLPLAFTWAALAFLQDRVSLAPGGSYQAAVDLVAGRPYLVAVVQEEIDVTVTLTGPDGATVAAVDGPYDRRGEETIALIAERSGRYALDVRAREVGAPPGSIEIRYDELADPSRLAAELAMTRGGSGYFLGTAEGRGAALAAYREAVVAYRAVGDRRGEARALYAAAVLARFIGETRRALDDALAVLPLWQELGESRFAAATENEIGLDHWLLGETAAGRAAFARAVALGRASDDRYNEAVAESNLCLMDLAAGDLRAGLACYGKALPLLDEIAAPALAGSARLNVGRAHDVLGEPDAARAAYLEAMDTMERTGDKAGAARVANHLGLLLYQSGDTADALAHYSRALAAFRVLGDRRWQAWVLHNLGYVYHGLGEWEQAVSSYRQALALWRDLGEKASEAATLAALGSARQQQGEPREALKLSEEAFALVRATGDRWREGTGLTQLAWAVSALGDHSRALATFEQAAEALRSVGAASDEGEALVGHAELELVLGRPASAAERAHRALILARATGNRPLEARAQVVLASAEKAIGHPAAAREAVSAALDLVESLRVRIGGPDLRASYSAFQERAYRLAVDLLLEAHRAQPEAGHDRAAFAMSERARARTLLELLNEADVDLAAAADPSLIERRRALLRRLSVRAERALQEKDPTRRAALEAEQRGILSSLDLVEAELRSAQPGYAALAQPRPSTAEAAQALLDSETVLVSYLLGETTSTLWAVTATSVATFELPGRQRIDERVRRYHARLADPDPAERAVEHAEAVELSRLLLAPLGGLLNRHRRLVIVGDGALHYLPFAALPEPGAETARLVERHEIVYLPSASVMAELRRMAAARKPAARRLAVWADPLLREGDPRFPPLPASRAEAEAIAALAPAGEVSLFLGAAARRTQLLASPLADFKALHFATHGVLDSAQPALSGLVLSSRDEAGTPEEGFVHLRDVYSLRLNAELVVLSGCRTALGKEARGEGLLGLTRGFFYAGAQRVVASLWPVEDRATAALMTRFYRAMWSDGLPPVAALRAAQRSVASERRWRDPYFWAGFVLQGRWD